MKVDRKWVERNLGFDPVAEPLPESAFAVARAARKSATIEDIQREIIDFDSEAPSGREFLAFSTATGLDRYTEIKWPAGLAPKTATNVSAAAGGSLPKADVLIVTWTVDERPFAQPGSDTARIRTTTTSPTSATSPRLPKR